GGGLGGGEGGGEISKLRSKQFLDLHGSSADRLPKAGRLFFLFACVSGRPDGRHWTIRRIRWGPGAHLLVAICQPRTHVFHPAGLPICCCARGHLDQLRAEQSVTLAGICSPETS